MLFVFSGRRSKQGRDLVYSYQRDILNCDSYRYFWLSWSDKTLKFGSGQAVGSGELMRYSDPSAPTINIMSVATGWGATGSWSLLDCDSKYYFSYLLFPSFLYS